MQALLKKQLFRIKLKGVELQFKLSRTTSLKIWRMLKTSPLKSSVLHFSVLQNRPNRGPLICSKIWYSYFCSNLSPISLLAYFFYFTILYWSNFVELIFRIYCYKPWIFQFRSNNDIIMPIDVGPRKLEVVAFSIRRKYLHVQKCTN